MSPDVSTPSSIAPYPDEALQWNPGSEGRCSPCGRSDCGWVWPSAWQLRCRRSLSHRKRRKNIPPPRPPLSKRRRQPCGRLSRAIFQKRPSDRQVLAKKLIGLAAEEGDADHPARQFAMLTLARDLAVDVGELPTAFEAVAALDRAFLVDPIKL